MEEENIGDKVIISIEEDDSGNGNSKRRLLSFMGMVEPLETTSILWSPLDLLLRRF